MRPDSLTDQEEGLGNKGCFGRTPWGLLIEFEQLPHDIGSDAEAEAWRWLPAPRRRETAPLFPPYTLFL